MLLNRSRKARTLGRLSANRSASRRLAFPTSVTALHAALSSLLTGLLLSECRRHRSVGSSRETILPNAAATSAIHQSW